MSSSSYFRSQLAEWGLHVSPQAQASLLGYAELLARYDKANVIGTKDYDQIVRHHVLDSLSCLLFPPLQEARKVADIGSGGGLPGLVLAIALPNAELTLFESVGKKTTFLRHAVEQLGLRNVRIVNGRVEEAGHQRAHREIYDVCTARAVARLAVLAEYCMPLLRVGGSTVAMKGRRDDEEWAEGERAVKVLGGEIRGEKQISHVPDGDQRERRLVVYEKMGRTPDAYPRRPGTPAREPLGRK